MTSAKPPPKPFRFAAPMILGLVLGSAAFAGYVFWSQGKAQHMAETVGEPDLAKPAADECAIARAAVTSIHASGDDARWRASDGDVLTLRAGSQVINPVDVPGYSDDQADNLRGKAAADWRWCPGMGAFVRSLGWSAMSTQAGTPELALGRPGVNPAADEAKVYEAYSAPEASSGAQLLKRGPWLATLHRNAGGAWQVVSTSLLSKASH